MVERYSWLSIDSEELWPQQTNIIPRGKTEQTIEGISMLFARLASESIIKSIKTSVQRK